MKNERFLAAAVFITLFAMLTGSCSPSGSPGAVDGQRIAVITQNLGDVVKPRPSVGEIAAVFREMPEADVYLLQEVGGDRMARAIGDKLSTGTRTYTHLYTGRAGIALLSSLPILESDIANDASAIQAVVDLDGTPVRAVSIHLPAFRKPREGDGDARIGPIYGALRLAREAITPNGRSRAAERILDWLHRSESPPPTIVGGDFNTVPLTLAPRKMTKRYNDSLWRSGDYWTGTYQRIAGPISARVDFLFHEPQFSVVNAFVHPTSAGDHLPVFAEYSLD